MYIGVSPYDAPSTFSLLQYTEFCDGVWYCRGGLARIADALAATAQAAGVRFLYSTEVDKIQVSGSHVTGVTLKGGGVHGGCDSEGAAQRGGGVTLTADVVVCAADLPWAYRNLLPDRGPADSMAKLKYTSSAIMFYWGVDRQYLQLETHNMFLAQDFKGSFDDIFRQHQLPEEPSFYVNVPSRIDASAAPAGHDTLMVLVPCGCLQEPSSRPLGPVDVDPQASWAEAVLRARKTVLARLRSDKGITDLDQHIRFEQVYTPHDWAHRFNLERGSCFGLSHTFLQLGFFRPHNQHAEYRNLFFAGCSTHPGSGLPNVLLSARLCVERLLMHSAGYSTESPVALKGAALGALWLSLVVYLASARFAMSYFAFHCVFTLPVVGVLALRVSRRVGAQRGSDTARIPQLERVVVEAQQLRVRMLHAALVLAFLALTYTTPWDNYLVYKGIWTYPSGRVLATIGWVPIEEYSFFVIQTALTCLWFLALLERHSMEARIAAIAGSSPYSDNPQSSSGSAAANRPSDAAIRVGGAALLMMVAAYCWRLFWLGPQHVLYMALILGWGLPVLALQWAFGESAPLLLPASGPARGADRKSLSRRLACACACACAAGAAERVCWSSVAVK